MCSPCMEDSRCRAFRTVFTPYQVLILKQRNNQARLDYTFELDIGDDAFI